MTPQNQTIRLDQARRDVARESLREFWQERFDQPISEFRLDQLLDFFCGDLGPIVYDQALEDAKAWLFEKLQDLSVDLRKET